MKGDEQQRSSDDASTTSTRQLLAIDLSGENRTIWSAFRRSLTDRLKSLCFAVANLETFKRRTRTGELNRLAHALLESLHAVLEMPARRNEKLKVEIEAIRQKTELDREQAGSLRHKTDAAGADESVLRTRQLAQRESNRELESSNS